MLVGSPFKTDRLRLLIARDRGLGRINSPALYRLSYRGTTKCYRSFAGTDDSPNPPRNSRRACPDRSNHPGFRCVALDSLALIVYKC